MVYRACWKERTWPVLMEHAFLSQNPRVVIRAISALSVTCPCFLAPLLAPPFCLATSSVQSPRGKVCWESRRHTGLGWQMLLATNTHAESKRDQNPPGGEERRLWADAQSERAALVCGPLRSCSKVRLVRPSNLLR